MPLSNRADVETFLTMLNALPGPRTSQVDPATARLQWKALCAMADVPAGQVAVRRDISIPGPAGPISARIYDARESRTAGPVMVFYHGGGFLFGDIASYEPFCSEAARVLDIPVISIDYRLAPENPYPAGVDDCEAATRWIATSPAELGRTVTGLIPCGDSAGGNLSVVTSIALRDRPAAAPVIAHFPIYPFVSANPDWPSMREHSDGKFLTADTMAYFGRHYGAKADDVRAHPLGSDMRGMPPAVVLTAGLDPLRDQGRAYAAALIEAGVAVTYLEAVGNIHGFINLRQAIPSSAQDIAGALTALKAMLA